MRAFAFTFKKSCFIRVYVSGRYITQCKAQRQRLVDRYNVDGQVNKVGPYISRYEYIIWV